MAELAGRHAVDNHQCQAEGEAEAHTQGMERATTVLISLIFHEKIETAAEAGNEADHEHDYQDF